MNIYFCVNGALSQDSSGHEQTFSDKDVFSPPGSSVGPARCPHAVHHAENLNVPPRKFCPVNVKAFVLDLRVLINCIKCFYLTYLGMFQVFALFVPKITLS